MLKHLSLFLLLAICIFPVASAAKDSQPMPVAIHISSAHDLTKDQAHGFRDFKRQAGYYGAFAVSSDQCTSYWFNNYHSLETASEMAVNACERLSLGNCTCTVYAVSLPLGEDPNTATSQVGMSFEASKAFHGKYKRKQRPGKYGAFAVSGIAEHYFSWQWATAEEARERALAGCEKYTADTHANLSNADWIWAISHDLQKCRIIHETGPEH